MVAVIGCNKPDRRSKDIRCEFVLASNKHCSDHATLQAGRIEFDEDGSFEFVGNYEACFDKRRVKATGQYRSQSFPDGINFELLAEEMSGAGSDSGHFPRTIGSLDLELKSLKGIYTDLWGIKLNSTPHPQGQPKIMTQCQ